MGSPLAVFLALRGIRPGNSGSQDHILPRSLCNRLLNIFHPTDPVVSVGAEEAFIFLSKGGLSGGGFGVPARVAAEWKAE